MVYYSMPATHAMSYVYHALRREPGIRQLLDSLRESTVLRLPKIQPDYGTYKPKETRITPTLCPITDAILERIGAHGFNQALEAMYRGEATFTPTQATQPR